MKKDNDTLSSSWEVAHALLTEKDKALIDKTTDFSEATAEVLRLKKQIDTLEAENKTLRNTL